jgi:hypothetical protein
VFVNKHLFCHRVSHTGLILVVVRLTVFWLLVLFDRMDHPGLGFLPVLLIIAIIFFPDCFVLEVWVKSPTAVSAVVILTSFLVAAIWAVITGVRPEEDIVPPFAVGSQSEGEFPAQTCPACGLRNTGSAAYCDCGHRFV